MRGGKRAGSGRKAGPDGPKGNVTLWLTADVSEYLKTFDSERSAKVDAAIRRTKEFKLWKKDTSRGKVIISCGTTDGGS